MICHYVSQLRRKGSNVSTKCQVASLVSWSGFFCSFLYLIIVLSMERGGKGEAKMGKRWTDRRAR